MSKVEDRLQKLEKLVTELMAEKDRRTRWHEVHNLARLRDVFWWNELDPDQMDELLETMKAAVKIWCERIGINVQFVQTTFDR